MSDEVVAAAEFKARCLALLDRVHARGEPITITKRGRVVARLVPAGEQDERPWTALRGKGRWVGDRFAPVVTEDQIRAVSRRRDRTHRR